MKHGLLYICCGCLSEIRRIGRGKGISRKMKNEIGYRKTKEEKGETKSDRGIAMWGLCPDCLTYPVFVPTMLLQLVKDRPNQPDLFLPQIDGFVKTKVQDKSTKDRPGLSWAVQTDYTSYDSMDVGSILLFTLCQWTQIKTRSKTQTLETIGVPHYAPQPRILRHQHIWHYGRGCVGQSGKEVSAYIKNFGSFCYWFNGEKTCAGLARETLWWGCSFSFPSAAAILNWTGSLLQASWISRWNSVCHILCRLIQNSQSRSTLI